MSQTDARHITRMLPTTVTWTKGIDPKTGKPADYDPTRDLQIYAAPSNMNDDPPIRAASFPFTSTWNPSRGPFGWTVTL